MKELENIKGGLHRLPQSEGKMSKKCLHNNGFYHTVKFWIFKKGIYVCKNCGEKLEGLGLAVWEREHRHRAECERFYRGGKAGRENEKIS